MSRANVEKQFAEIYSLIELHRSRAFQSINNETLYICWEVGFYVHTKLLNSEWGDKVVAKLSNYLVSQDKSLKGYSRRSIYKMVKFYEEYSDRKFLYFLSNSKTKELFKLSNNIMPTMSAQLPEEKISPINELVPTMSAVTSIPKILLTINWSQHCEIMDSCRTHEERTFYILYAYRERLNVRELRRAIKTSYYTRFLSGNEIQSCGLKKIYPSAKHLFKNVACLDFLGLPDKYYEKHLQEDILNNMKSFIMELGKDFIFIDKEYPLTVGNRTFRIDLLFYHRELQCLVAVELKTTEFEPSYMGQLEFYLEALDQDVKKDNENPSIGILLCREANKDIVKYALNRSMSPTMIAKYEQNLIPRDALERSFQKTIDRYQNT
jgi:predicted nuclease of restriction endonuclease-like (RecB) superfamily